MKNVILATNLWKQQQKDSLPGRAVSRQRVFQVPRSVHRQGKSGRHKVHFLDRNNPIQWIVLKQCRIRSLQWLKTNNGTLLVLLSPKPAVSAKLPHVEYPPVLQVISKRQSQTAANSKFTISKKQSQTHFCLFHVWIVPLLLLVTCHAFGQSDMQSANSNAAILTCDKANLDVQKHLLTETRVA